MQTDITDYNTSQETYHNIKQDIPNTREAVYQYILDNGTVTCKELARIWHCSSNDISGRFTELLASGRIVVVGKKTLGCGCCRVYRVV